MPRKLSQDEWDRRADAAGISWLEQVSRRGDAHRAQCRSCGEEFPALPITVGRGVGCPYCSGKLVSSAEWDRRAAAVGIEWLAPPASSITPTPARCSSCGREWKPKPSKVAEGHGCRECSNAARRIPQAEWDRRAAAVGCTWLEPVGGNHDYRLIRCDACSNEWRVDPNSIAGGTGCKQCSNLRAGIARRVPQAKWDERAAAVHMRWLAPVHTAHEPARAECLACGWIGEKSPAGTSQGEGCPRCAGKGKTQADWDARAAKRGFRWLAPVAAGRIATPAECLACGHHFTPVPSGRGGCPECGRTRASLKRRRSADEWQARARENANAVILSTIETGSTPVEAECRACGHRWLTSPKSLAAGRGCPACAGALPITQDEWDQRAAAQSVAWEERVRSSHAHAMARCLECDHRWRVTPGRISAGSGCPICRKRRAGEARRVTRERRDAEALAIGMEWVDAPGAGDTPCRIRCLECEYVDEVTPNSVARGRRCRQCADRLPLDQAAWDARAAAVGVRWRERVVTSQARYLATCTRCGHDWRVRAANIARGAGCPVCRREEASAKRRASRTQRDQEAAAVGIRWLEPPERARVPTLAECLTCHRQYKVTPNAVQSGARCSVCVGQLVTQDDWHERARAAGIEWLAPVKSRSTPTPARCTKCQWVWEAWPSRIRDGGGCPKCAHYGLNPSAPGLLYLLLHEELSLMKIGIMAQSSSRLRQHKRRGWDVVQTWTTDTAARAARIEDLIVEWWQERGCVFALRSEVPAGDGFTETVHVGKVSVPRTIAAVEAALQATPDTVEWQRSVITPMRRTKGPSKP
jgi:hypothetical protein